MWQYNVHVQSHFVHSVPFHYMFRLAQLMTHNYIVHKTISSVGRLGTVQNKMI